MIARKLPADLMAAVEAKAASAAGVASRIWAKDDTVWGHVGQEEVSNRLGWLDIADRLRPEADDLVSFARAVAEEGMTDVVLLGMGGSSLASPRQRLPSSIAESSSPATSAPISAAGTSPK